MKKQSWFVKIGFAVGDPSKGNARWFTVADNCYNTTKQQAIQVVRNKGYLSNLDICSDWVFEIHPITEEQ